MNGCHIKPEQFFNLIFGYNDRYYEYGSDLTPSAGDYDKWLTVVPAGEIWVLQAISARDLTTAKRILLGVGDGTLYMVLKDETENIAGRSVIWNGSLVLKAGDKVRIYFISVTAGDDLEWDAWGYKMKVA